MTTNSSRRVPNRFGLAGQVQVSDLPQVNQDSLSLLELLALRIGIDLYVTRVENVELDEIALGEREKLIRGRESK